MFELPDRLTIDIDKVESLGRTGNVKAGRLPRRHTFRLTLPLHAPENVLGAGSRLGEYTDGDRALLRSCYLPASRNLVIRDNITPIS